jgi:hypothetical protein
MLPGNELFSKHQTTGSCIILMCFWNRERERSDKVEEKEVAVLLCPFESRKPRVISSVPGIFETQKQHFVDDNDFLELARTFMQPM